MNAKEFYDAVVAMRNAQKRYERSHMPDDRHECEKDEGLIDREIKRVKQIAINSTNLSIHFNEDLYR